MANATLNANLDDQRLQQIVRDSYRSYTESIPNSPDWNTLSNEQRSGWTAAINTALMTSPERGMGAGAGTGGSASGIGTLSG